MKLYKYFWMYQNQTQKVGKIKTWLCIIKIDKI